MDVREKLIEICFSEFCDLAGDSQCGCDGCPYGEHDHDNGGCYVEYKKDKIEKLENDMDKYQKEDNSVTVQEWISVNDRLPEQSPNRVDEQGRSWFTPDIDCIVYDGKIVFAAHYSFQNKFFWYSDTLHPLKNITHWMYLPQPPKGE